jgi:DNA replicative helicase MCM subunit Mcm2 (Cdc46/Mcm family)
MSYQTRANKIDILIDWLSRKTDVSKIRPRQNIRISIDEDKIYKIFCDEYQNFDSMIDDALFQIIQNHFAKLSAKCKSDYVEGDVKQIMREKLSGKLKLDKYRNLTHTIFLDTVTSMQNINPDIEGKPVAFDSLVMFADDPKSYVVEGKAYCALCHSKGNITLTYDYEVKLPWCSDCKISMKLDKESARSEFIQTLLLEEFPESASNNSPVKFTCKLRGELVGKVFVGQRKRFVGFFRSDIDTKKKENPVYLEILSVQDCQEIKECVITDVEANKFREMPDLLQALIDSFAPYIKSRDLEKTAMLLSAVSGVDNFDLRSRSHILLCGDPGTGKSELCRFLVKIIPKGDIVDGNAVSQSGLVFGLDKLSSGKQVPKAGYVILNNGGILIIDEFDKCGKNERKALHGVLEQGIARYTKIQAMKASAIITMIATANPKYLTWKEGMSIMDNLEPIEKTILDRCDLIIRVRPLEDVSKKTAALESFLKGMNMETMVSPLDITTLKGYIAYARRLQPTITQEALQEILDFYTAMQTVKQKDDSPPMDQRQGEAISRLAVCFAKLLLKDVVDAETARKTISFYRDCLKTLGMNTDEGITQIPMESAHLTKEEAFWMAVSNVEKDEIGRFHEGDLIQELIKNPRFKTEEIAERYFRQMADHSAKLIKRAGKYQKA